MFSNPPLSEDEHRRYARQLVLSEFGHAGQSKLKAAHVLVVGAGGLGSATLSYLATAGVGQLTIIDHDSVELSNLNRQILHETGDIGRRKVESAADRIAELNPEVQVTRVAQRVEIFFQETPNALHGYDLVVDGTDHFSTRFAVAEACHQAGVTLVSAAVRGFAAHISTFKSHLGVPHPCYRCWVPALPHQENDCAAQGILGPLVGVMGSMQALEAIKELTSIGQSLSGRMLRYDALSGQWASSRLMRDPACVLCGEPHAD
ncbi:MAG: molybdopterin-synthase adenylyltransferase MoeB [Rickettsiales bacterium]|nr:molybdopterin-synthase adenylyltransferase MoeB [Rickettsiales bacterium]